jgi:hypothetical protein
VEFLLKITIFVALTIPEDCEKQHRFYGGSVAVKQPTRKIFTRTIQKELTPKFTHSLFVGKVTLLGASNWTRRWDNKNRIHLVAQMNRKASEKEVRMFVRRGWKFNKKSSDYFGAVTKPDAPPKK